LSQLRFKVTGGGEAPPLLFSGGGGGEELKNNQAKGIQNLQNFHHPKEIADGG